MRQFGQPHAVQVFRPCSHVVHSLLQLLKEKTDGRLLVEALVPDFQVSSPIPWQQTRTQFGTALLYAPGTSSINEAPIYSGAAAKHLGTSWRHHTNA